MTDQRTQSEQDGRVARGDATRTRLLEAAVRIFAARGFADVTTREIAEAAGANQAAILYHFGGKEQLHLAAAEYVATRARAALHDVLGDAAASDDAPAVETLRAVLRSLTRGMIAMAADGAVADFIVREQAHTGPAFDVLYRGYIREVHERVTALVARATFRAPDDPSVVIDAHAIVGMSLSFAAARSTFLRRTHSRRYTAADAEEIAERVAELATRTLHARKPASH